MRLRTLLEIRPLGLRLLCGAEQLDRTVRGVATADPRDPGGALTGGELVLTGLAWRRTPEDSERFVRHLATAGAAALAAGETGAGPGQVPHDLIMACARHRLPLFAVSEDVAFSAITEQVARRVPGARNGRTAVSGPMASGSAGPAAGPAATRRAPAGPARGLRGALEAPRHLHRGAAARPVPVPATGPAPAPGSPQGRTASHLRLLSFVPDEVRRDFADRLLGPLHDYDIRHRAELVLTLRAFLDCDASWSRCAARLHLHVNTLRYRMARIEQLTGRDLARLTDRLDFFLALRMS